MPITDIVTGKLCTFDRADYFRYAAYGYTIHTQPSGYMILRISGGPHRNKHYARLIMGADDSNEVDHIDGNTLNNVRSNLRLVTRAQNNTNRDAYNKYDTKGVWKNGNSWVAQIRVNGTLKYLGSWPIKSFADAAFKAAAEKYQKEFAAHTCRD